MTDPEDLSPTDLLLEILVCWLCAVVLGMGLAVALGVI